MSGKHRGPKSKFPTTDLGIFIQKRLDVMNMTRAELAKRLHVSPSTIVRMLNGDTKVIQQVRPESLCEALELDKVNRREFLKIVSATGFALATGSIAPKTIVRSRIDLDFADDHLKALQHLLDQGGQERFVVESAQRWYNTLLQEYPETGDARIA